MKLHIITLLLTLSTIASQAQDVKINEKEMFLNDKYSNVYELELKGEIKQVEKDGWLFCKSELGLKLQKKEDGWGVEKQIVHAISDKKIDFISSFYVSNGVPVLAVSVPLGYNIYVSSQVYKEEDENIKIFMERFAFIQYDEFYSKLITDRLKYIKQLDKTNANNNKLITKSEKTLIKNKKKQAKKEVNGLTFEIERMTKQVEDAKELRTSYEKELLRLDDDIFNANTQIIKVRSLLNK